MNISRRELITMMGVAAASGLSPKLRTWAQPPVNTPLPRMPLDEFVQSEAMLGALRKGVSEMKKRKPSDPLSWFYQAAIHGVTDEAVKKAVKDDPNVANVFSKKYWNQCPHDGENSADFLPWHRGYTFYFERILRMHTEDDKFSLPYWNYHSKANRKFPKEFGVKHLDGNLMNDSPENINPLHMEERDFYFTTYEHPFASGFPLLELSDSAVDISIPMNSSVFFGNTEQEGIGGGIYDENPRTRGLFESYPHDHIHRSVGGVVVSPSGVEGVGAMALPPTAGFDPIFCVHHANIDRLWAEWSCLPGKTWGTLPSNYWFNEKPWFFYNENSQVVNEPRKTYFDHRALGVRFKYEDMSCAPLQLPSVLPEAGGVDLLVGTSSLLPRKKTILSKSTELSVGSSMQRFVRPVSSEGKLKIQAPIKVLQSNILKNNSFLATVRAQRRIFLRLLNIDLESSHATGYDVHVTDDPFTKPVLSRNDRSFVGSLALFNHASNSAHSGHVGPSVDDRSQSFDISRAVSDLSSQQLAGLSVVLVPYKLLDAPGKEAVFLGTNVIRFNGIEFFEQ